MFDAISSLFGRDEPDTLAMEPRLAVAVLLVHLAAVDGAIKDEERDAVRGALIDYYELSEDEVDKLIDEATRRDSESVDFYRFTSALSSLPDEEKREIIRM